MAKYDLTGALETKFTFSIGDKEFEFRKPTVREMREVAKMFSGIDKEKDPEKQVEASDKAMAELYKFVVPIGHDANIADLMQDQPLGVQNAFNDMIKTELVAAT
jgi:hypothetical protein